MGILNLNFNMEILQLLFVLISICETFCSTGCDNFHYNSLCLLSPADNILDVNPNTESEIQCQEECSRLQGCSFFTYERFASGSSDCFLFKECDLNKTASCDGKPECSLAVSGPVSPAMTEACCSAFAKKACPSQNEISQAFDVHGEQICQNLCRDTFNCNYWTLYGDVCFLYSACDNPNSCSVCTSGPAFPDISKCNSYHVQHTLLLGGKTDNANYATTIEIVTPNMVCSPGMAQLPVGRRMASATLLGSKIFYCGGFNDGVVPSYHKTCHSYLIGNSNTWHEEPSMVFDRANAAMSTIGGTIYVSGGEGDYGRVVNHASVESYSEGRGWMVESNMALPRARAAHCSVVLDTFLILIGGVDKKASASVQYFPTHNISGTWQDLKPLITGRYKHACQTGEFEGQPGIFVAGGYTSTPIASVEFYVAAANRWQSLGRMKTTRGFHTLSVVNGKLLAAGGTNGKSLTSVETWNSTDWTITNNLQVAREQHTAVSVPAGMISC